MVSIKRSNNRNEMVASAVDHKRYILNVVGTASIVNFVEQFAKKQGRRLSEKQRIKIKSYLNYQGFSPNDDPTRDLVQAAVDDHLKLNKSPRNAARPAQRTRR